MPTWIAPCRRCGRHVPVTDPACGFCGFRGETDADRATDPAHPPDAGPARVVTALQRTLDDAARGRR